MKILFVIPWTEKYETIKLIIKLTFLTIFQLLKLKTEMK
jgi:hypothetical protein